MEKIIIAATDIKPDLHSMDTTRFFDTYYKNAVVNSILIMDEEGTIIDVNQSFTNNFGYDHEAIKGQNFSILFTQKDREENKPALELAAVKTKGQSNDENYIVTAGGRAIWCTGESIWVPVPADKAYIVKDIINLQTKRHLQLLLADTEVLLEKMFESAAGLSVMVLDGSMRIRNLNDAFLRMFEMEPLPAGTDRLADLHHPFWGNPDIKDRLRRLVINGEPIPQTEFVLHNKSGEARTVELSSKNIGSQGDSDRKIYIMVEER